MKNFLISISIAFVIFCVITLVLASVHGNNFLEEISSWFSEFSQGTQITETTNLL